MQKRLVRVAAAALLALLLPHAAHAQPPTEPPPALAAPEGAAPPEAPEALEYRVEIDAPRELREMLEQGLRLLRWQNDPQMDATLLERLVAEARADVRQAVATRGFFAAEVTTRIDRDTRPWTVRIRVEPGAPARVSSAEIDYSGPATGDPLAQGLLARIREEWRLPPGARFSQDAWNHAKEAAVRTLAERRYAGARIAASRAQVNPRAGEAALHVEIDSGPLFRYGDVEVSGTERYPASMVAELSPVERGAPYRRESLRLYERRLLATGYFVSAQADLVADRDRAEAAPVRVSVIEGRSQQIEAGLGFNTDVGPRIEGRYANFNIFESAWRLGSEIRLDDLNRQGRLDLDTPPRSGGRWRNHFLQWSEKRVQNEETRELSGGFSFNWGLGGEPSAFQISVHDEEQLVGELVDHRHALFLGYRTQLRDTDAWELPRRGTIVELALGGAPAGVATQAFLRATAGLLWLIPLGRHDLLLRAQAGVVVAESRQGIPSTFLFRTGGDQTVRGYAFESLGVRRADAVVGGRYLLLGGIEYTHWIGENWGVAAFVDAGNAWDSGRFEAAYGPGIGVRLRTPIGPVRADLAYGMETDQYRLHFSVGFTF